MAPVIIPEGFVLVKPRSRETAIALLDAADEIGADRHLSVRTVTGGYHVAEAVAAKFQESFPEADVEDDAPDEVAGPEESGDPENSGELAPLPVTADNTHSEIDEYAAGLNPAVEFPKDTNKADKIALLEAARQPKTPAE